MMAIEGFVRGKCYCGSVQFKFSLPTDFCAHCHCASCRLSHGASYVTWTSVPNSNFSITQGADLISWYRSSKWVEWGFCKTCGSSMLYRAIQNGHPESPKLDRMYVTVGSLIDPMDQPATCHVSYEERLPNSDFKDDLPKYRGKGIEQIG